MALCDSLIEVNALYLFPGDQWLSQGGVMTMSPLQLHCITKQLTLPVESIGERVGTHERRLLQWVPAYPIVGSDVFGVFFFILRS